VLVAGRWCYRATWYLVRRGATSGAKHQTCDWRLASDDWRPLATGDWVTGLATGLATGGPTGCTGCWRLATGGHCGHWGLGAEGRRLQLQGGVAWAWGGPGLGLLATGNNRNWELGAGWLMGATCHWVLWLLPSFLRFAFYCLLGAGAGWAARAGGSGGASVRPRTFGLWSRMRIPLCFVQMQMHTHTHPEHRTVFVLFATNTEPPTPPTGQKTFVSARAI
jgi:hypothetical protein